MKRFIAFVLILLFSMSSLQLCSANEIDGRNSNTPNTSNVHPIIIQMPANPPKDPKGSKNSNLEKFKDIVDIAKWPAILGGAVFLYIKYHKPVEEYADSVSFWSKPIFCTAWLMSLCVAVGYGAHGVAALVKAIKGGQA